ncbi:hypothetical protein ID852_07605 [Xenorhabdus sp. 42]|uniref:hypothetical protein n=1 Tax=Xenorhabdus szentirmaii TaxID=290112 RepID=UPI0019B6C8D6|nr:hypothetical protein [Xenorhabdus sp. 42]MBD2820559.1 hypothetical protein [Xenorhabdus sp. 42]
MGNNYLEWFYRPMWQLLLLQQFIVILLLLSFYFFLWQNNQQKLQSLRGSLAEQHHHTTLSQQRLAELPRITDIQKQIQQVTAEIGQNTPPITHLAALKQVTVLKRLHFPLIRSGSQLIEWKIHKENDQVFWHIMLSQSYDQFLHFLNEIQQLHPPLLIKHLSINPVDGGLNVRMVLSDTSLPDAALPKADIPDKAEANLSDQDKS